jgi:hypothetical protein
MKRFRLLLIVSFCLIQVQAKDLHLVDGRVFKEVSSIAQFEVGTFRFRHQAGSGSVPTSLLSRSDFFEHNLHLGNVTTPPPPAAPAVLAHHSYVDRDYSTRSFADRGYAPETTAYTGLTGTTYTPRYERSYAPKTETVSGYYRQDGTYVGSYKRSRRSR